MKYSFFSSELFCPPSALMMAVSASAASSAPLASWVKYVPGREAGGCGRLWEVAEAPTRRYESEQKGKKKYQAGGGEKTAPAPRKADGARCGSSWCRRPPGPPGTTGPALQRHGAALPAVASPLGSTRAGGAAFTRFA